MSLDEMGRRLKAVDRSSHELGSSLGWQTRQVGTEKFIPNMGAQVRGSQSPRALGERSMYGVVCVLMTRKVVGTLMST